jgi:hypothetical protein
MLAKVRRHSPVVTIALLVSMVAFGGSLVRPHLDDCHDAGCGAVAISHDESAHRVGTAEAAADHPLHCVACHWARSFRPAEGRIASAPAGDSGVRLQVEIVLAAPVAHAAQPPLRSPPATLTLS